MCLSAVKLDRSGELFWDTPSWLSAWVSVFWAWRMNLDKGVPTLFAYCEKSIWKCFFKLNQGTCPWMTFAWIFLIFLKGSVGQIIYRENTVFLGSNISCSLACVALQVLLCVCVCVRVRVRVVLHCMCYVCVCVCCVIMLTERRRKKSITHWLTDYR